MDNELQPSGKGEVSTEVHKLDDGLGQANAKDLSIARLTLMQGMSDAVVNGTAKLGEILLDSGEKIADLESGVEIVPLKVFKDWRVMRADKPKPVWVKTIPWSPEAEAIYREKREGLEDITGKNGQVEKQVKVKYMFGFNFYVLLRTKEDSMPAIVSFRSTSVRAGSQLYTMMLNQKRMRKPAHSRSAQLGAKKVKNDDGTFAIFTVKEGTKLTDAELAAATGWLEQLSGYTGPIVEEMGADDRPVASQPVIHHDDSQDLDATGAF